MNRYGNGVCVSLFSLMHTHTHTHTHTERERERERERETATCIYIVLRGDKLGQAEHTDSVTKQCQ